MVRKTFFFSALLIVLVTLISFAVLYFAMPGYYLLKKEQALQDNLDILTTQLKAAETQQDYTDLIAEFVVNSNSIALAFDAVGLIVPELSSPLVSMERGGEENTYYIAYTIADDYDGEDPADLPITIEIRRDGSLPGVSDAGENQLFNGFRFSSEGAALTDAGQEDAFSGDVGQEIKQRTLISYDTNGNTITLNGQVDTELLSYITVSSTLQPIDEAKGVILSLIPYALLIGIAMGLLLSWIYARQISKPILKISAAAERMQHLEPEALSGIRSKDEVGLLSTNLDALYASLRENIGQLQQEMDKVSRLERAKTEMMQSASHELKTPVAALSGMLEGMIDNIGVYRDKEKYLQECKGQVEKLALLVAEILNASQAEDMQEVEFSDTAVEDLIRQALTDHTLLIEEKGLRLGTDLTPLTITTDPSALYRVFTNLIGNAVRHTPPGGEIRVTLSSEVFSIENSCTPIPEEELPKLFEPFYTRSYSRDKAESGTGLGLYIVKRNLERLNIHYTVESTEPGLKITLFL